MPRSTSASSSGLTARGAQIHVAVTGDDSNPGTLSGPLRTIQRAADLAQPGDSILIHGGVYRERISPPRGGESESRRITYQAAPGEEVQIKGSEVVPGWAMVQDDVWTVTLANSLFGDFNPYSDIIKGDWFNPLGRVHHTGAVYLNGEWLTEAAGLDDVLRPSGGAPMWFGRVEKEKTRIWARFKSVDPNEQLVEINVRKAVFYPEKTNINFLTVRGLTMRHTATPWAPPTAEQFGLIGTHWSKGWIIEGNVISHSACSGIALGKYGDEFDNASSNSAEGYVETIHRALKNGWNKDTIGGHIVRNNAISHCEQAGIVGSLGAAFSVVSGNSIHDVYIKRLFGGSEMAGIKFHGAIDVEISHNHVYRTGRGLWLDWMAQGTRVTANLFHDNDDDVYVEVNHGPYLMDNNIFLSPISLHDASQGGAFVHNLMAGEIRNLQDGRRTPFHKAHSTELAGKHGNPGGDDRYYNNLFVERPDLAVYNASSLPVHMDGNVFLKGAEPSSVERTPIIQPGFDPALRLLEGRDGFHLEIALDRAWLARKRRLMTTEALGSAVIPNLPYEQADGAPLRIDSDYSGKKRNPCNPTPGPFEDPGTGLTMHKVW